MRNVEDKCDVPAFWNAMVSLLHGHHMTRLLAVIDANDTMMMPRFAVLCQAIIAAVQPGSKTIRADFYMVRQGKRVISSW